MATSIRTTTLLLVPLLATAAAAPPAGKGLAGASCRVALTDADGDWPAHRMSLHPPRPPGSYDWDTCVLQFTASPALAERIGLEAPKTIAMPHRVTYATSAAPVSRRIFIASRDEAHGVTLIDVLSVDFDLRLDEHGVPREVLVGPTIRRVAETSELEAIDSMSYVPWTNTLVVVERTEERDIFEFDLATGDVTPLAIDRDGDWPNRYLLVRPYGDGGSLTLWQSAGCSVSSELVYVDADGDGTWELPDDAAREALPAYPTVVRWRDPGSRTHSR